MAIKLDFSDVDTGFGPLEPGTYMGSVAKITQEIGKNSGKPYLAVVIKLHTTEGVEEGRQVFTNLSLQPKALWRLKRLLVRLGFDEKELAGELNFEEGELIGREVTVILGPPDQGYSNNRVIDVFGPDYEGAETSPASNVPF